MTVTILGTPPTGSLVQVDKGTSLSVTQATNLGTGNGVFSALINSVFQFKSLIAGTNVTITNNTNDLTFSVDLSGYVLTSTLTSNYVSNTSLASTLTGYVTNLSNYVHKTSDITPSPAATGSIYFKDGSTFLGQDNTNFTWDNTNKKLIVGTGTLSVADVSIGRVKVGYSTGDNSVFHIAGIFQAEQTAATTNSIQGVEGYTKVSHGSGTVNLAIGTIGNFEMASTQTVSLARSVQAGGNLTAAGTVSEWNGFFVSLTNSGGATVTNGYGLKVAVFPSGVTNKFSIYTADTTATNYLSGKVTLAGLPTSTGGLPTGSLWNNAGVINIVP